MHSHLHTHPQLHARYVHLSWEIGMLLLYIRRFCHKLLMHIYWIKAPISHLRWGPYLLHLPFWGYRLDADYLEHLTERQLLLFLLEVQMPMRQLMAISSQVWTAAMLPSSLFSFKNFSVFFVLLFKVSPLLQKNVISWILFNLVYG